MAAVAAAVAVPAPLDSTGQYNLADLASPLMRRGRACGAGAEAAAGAAAAMLVLWLRVSAAAAAAVRHRRVKTECLTLAGEAAAVTLAQHN